MKPYYSKRFNWDIIEIIYNWIFNDILNSNQMSSKKCEDLKEAGKPTIQDIILGLKMFKAGDTKKVFDGNSPMSTVFWTLGIMRN